MIYFQIKNFFLDKVIVSTLSKVTSAIFDSLDDIQIRQKWQEIVNYFRGKITANEMAKRFWRQYIPIYKVHCIFLFFLKINFLMRKLV